MNKNILYILFYFLFFSHNLLFAQSPVTVNPLTGSANVTIPLYTLKSGSVSLPMSINYTSTGVKIRDVEGTAGMGWQLSAGGQVSRIIRGIPDDVLKDVAGSNMIGWMSSANTYANSINSFNLQNDGGVTCSKETTDIANINTNFPYNFDTEPDIFYVNVPGLYCQMVYDRTTAKFRPIQYLDLVISYTTNSTTGLITSFTIVNDKGVKYVFDNPEAIIQQTIGNAPSYFATKYNQYKNGISFNDSWALTSITDANGNGIKLVYTTGIDRSTTSPISLYLPGATTATLQYKILQTVTPVTLSSIFPFNVNTTGNVGSGFTFNWIPSNHLYGSGQTIIESIIGCGRSFKFLYDDVGSTNGTLARSFLRNFSESMCLTPVNYEFGYAGESLVNHSYMVTSLPDSSSTLVDYWGYYSTSNSTGSLRPQVMVNPSNGSYPRYNVVQASAFTGSYTFIVGGNIRIADPTNVMAGSLNKIVNATGGNTAITYESNDYVDMPSGQVQKGGGIRVKQIIDDPGTGSPSVITRNYSYLNGSGVSSGRPMSLPAFAFTVPYSGSATGNQLWNNNTVLSDYDLSNEDHTIVYGYSRVSQTGAGSTQYQYYIPATYWDTNAIPGCNNCTTPEWNPTINMVGRYDCNSTYGPVKSDHYSYPFTPNPNYTFEQGLPQKISSYNDGGNIVSETNYNYQRSYTPSTITAFKSDDFSNGGLIEKAYNKYTIYYNTSELTLSITKKIYDASNAGQARVSTVNYAYNSSFHKLPTQQIFNNSDNSIETINFAYVKDYSVIVGSNPNINALYYLQQQNMNMPVETWKQVTRNNTTLTTEANLTLFKGFPFVNNPTLYLPSQQLKLTQPNGTVFTPYAINSGAQTNDNKYFTEINYDSFDNTGFAQTIDDANKHIQTVIADHAANQTSAIFKNASSAEIAFSDFDSQLGLPLSNFVLSGSGVYSPVGSHSGNASGLYANTQIMTSPSLTKSANAKNYIFSVWVNANTAGILTLTLTGVSNHPSISYIAGGWKYYELSIPAAALPANFTVSFNSNQSISIDDILFYPDMAEVSTFGYDPITHFKTSETNTNGVSTYFVNDAWGRVLYKLDQDKNILQKNTYVLPQNVISFSPTISLYSNPYVNTPIQFSIFASDCTASPATIDWDFGDGSAHVSTGLSNYPSHVYSSTGSKTITAIVNSPLYGSKTISLTINVTDPPPPPPSGPMVTLSYTNTVTSGGAISQVTFIPKVSGGASYIFSGPQLNNAKILPGAYNISVIVSGGQLYNSSTGTGYSSVYLSGSCNSQCLGYSANGNFSFSLDLSNCSSFNFTISPRTCIYFLGQ